MNLKTGVAYKPRITPTLMRGLTSPGKVPQGRKSWEDGQGRPSPDRVGCWTAQPHGDGMRKQTGAPLQTADNTCSLRTGGVQENWQVANCPQQPWRNQVTSVPERAELGGAVLQGSPASLRLTSLGQGQVRGL